MLYRNISNSNNRERRRRIIAKCERDWEDAIYFVVYLHASFVAQ